VEHVECGINGTLVIDLTCFTYIPPIFIRKFLFYPQQQITEICVLIRRKKNVEYAAEIYKNIVKNYLNFK